VNVKHVLCTIFGKNKAKIEAISVILRKPAQSKLQPNSLNLVALVLVTASKESQRIDLSAFFSFRPFFISAFFHFDLSSFWPFFVKPTFFFERRAAFIPIIFRLKKTVFPVPAMCVFVSVSGHVRFRVTKTVFPVPATRVFM
jgi:hypothetical protein